MKDPADAAKTTGFLKEIVALALLAAFLSGSRCATASFSSRRTGGPIRIFEHGQRIPRNSKILEIVDSWGPWAGTCRYITIIRRLVKTAKVLGGDAIAILHAREPIIGHSCFIAKAFLLDQIDIDDWPRIALTEDEIRRDLDAGGRTLDDIEGIWDSRVLCEVIMDEVTERAAGVLEYSRNGAPKGTLVWQVLPSVIQAMGQLSPEEQSSYRVAIVKAAGDPDYPYAAYILDPEIPEWQPGFLKARIRELSDSSGYEAKWYGTTFQDDLREFHPDETGALKTKVVVELGLKYSIEQVLTRIYPPATANHAPD
jgi:hypothetical protein